MTASKLKYQYQFHIPSGHFFDRKTMRFFGDTMRNYGVRDADTHWELFRRSPVKHGLIDSRWFDKGTFAETSTDPNE
jgi:hypothetical protein